MAKTRGIAIDTNNEDEKKSKTNHIIAIAIDAYNNGQDPLTYPVSECERLIQLLTDRYEFDSRNVVRLFNEKATKELLRDELYELPRKLGPQDNLLLVFAGHGFYDANIEEGYWIPVDAPRLKSDREAEDVLFSFQRIVKYLNKAKAHHIVFMIDSCFSGGFGQVTMKVPTLLDSGNIPPEEIPSRWVMTSGRKELVADNSPFAKAIWESLRDNQREQLLLQVLYSEVRQKMSTGIAQTASCSEIVAGEARGGEFAFRLQEGLALSDVPRSHKAIDPTALRQRLRRGSREYLAYLKKGRFAKLQFEKILLPDTQAELLDVTVQMDETTTPLQQAMQQLWSKGTPHTLIVGEGGMGKTVSCVRLWEEMLETGKNGPVPIFIPLNEYNGTTEAERESKKYLYQFIAREYLDDTRLTPELEDAIKELLKQEGEQPAVLLLLDGFNEVTLEKRPLMVELAEFVRRAKGVQIAVTSRYEMRNFTWTKGFERLDLVDLSIAQIETYLKEHQTAIPDYKNIQTLLGNPMMLTLYTGASQLAAQFKEDQRFSFKTSISAKGELLHQFIEAQLAKYWLDNAMNAGRDKEFIWQSFLLRHVLPFLAYRMVEEGQFFIHSRKLLNPAFNFKSVILEAYDYFASFDFTDLYPSFAGHRSYLGFGVAKDDFDALEDRNRRIRSYLVHKLFLLSEEGDIYGFLHQNFRDYFAAIHVRRQIEWAIAQNQDAPPEKRKLPLALQKAPMDFYARQILGEIEGEHLKVPTYSEEEKRWSIDHYGQENLLFQLLEQCRNVFDKNQLGYTVWNMLTIRKELTHDFSGLNLSKLNFQYFTFNNLRAFRPPLTVDFTGSILEEKNLFPRGHSEIVWSTAYSPDGSRIVSGSSDKTVKIWDEQSGECLLTLKGHLREVSSAAYSPDGNRVVSGSSDATVRIWDAQSGACLMMIESQSSNVESAIYSTDGSRILIGSTNGIINVCSAASGECLLTFKGHSSSVKSMAYSIDSSRIVSKSFDESMKVWDAQSGRCLVTFDKSSSVKSTAYSPDSSRIVSGSYNHTVQIWDVQSGQCLMTFEGHSSSVNSTTYSPDGSRIVSGSDDHTIKIWDVESGQCLMTFEGHSSSVNSTSYSPDGSRIVSGSDDHTVKVWDAQSGQCIMTFEGHSSKIKGTTYSPDGSRIISGSSNNTAKIWDVQSGQCFLTLGSPSFYDLDAVYSPDGSQIVGGSRDGLVMIWDAQSGQHLIKLEGYFAGIWSIAYSPDGSRIVGGSYTGKIKVWDAYSGRCILMIEGPTGGVTGIAFSPSSSAFATVSFNNTAKIWDVQSGDCLLEIKRDSLGAMSVAFSPDGSQVVIGDVSKTANVWDAQSGQHLLTLEAQVSGVWSTAYHPDGSQIVGGSQDGLVMIWDAQSGQCLITLEGHSSAIWSVAYNLDGSRILSGSSEGMVHEWDAQSGQCLLTIPNIPGLFIQGADFRQLHPDSKLSEKEINLLKQYSGIFDDEDAERWAQLMEKHFGIKNE